MLFIKAEYEEEHVHRKILCKCQWPPGICPVGCWPCGSEQAPQWSGGGEYLEAFRVETLPGELVENMTEDHERGTGWRCRFKSNQYMDFI